MITIKKMILGIIVLIALSIHCSGFVNASATESYVTLQPTIVPLNFNTSQEPDSGVEIQNVSETLIFWNERMGWGLSQIQLRDNSIKVENEILKNLKTTDGKRFHIKNLTRFDEELGTLIGLSDAQISAFIIENQNQLEIDHMNYHKPYQSQKTELLSSISPGSQSAPSAQGKLFYLYIFTDFSIPSSYGTWTQEHMDDAEIDAGSGTWQIQNQSPSGANVINSGAKGHVTVIGQNLGDDITTWGPDGWMENGAQQFAFGQSGPYNRATENLAYNLKQTYNAGSVILVFLTHDNKGAIATGPDQGYADKVLVSYWGPSFISEPGSYEHEIVHSYGALDEYQGNGNGIRCNYWPSGLAVSPMYEMYQNSNFETCPSSTKRGVMYYPYNDPTHPYWWEISQASRRWIGWGDFDRDGILDPRDSTPYGNGGLIIGVFRSGEWILDYGIDGTVDRRLNYGLATDIPVVGNFNNDGTPDIGVFRSGQWILDYGMDGTVDRRLNFAQTDDKPVVGDFNNDGTTDIGVFRSGQWILDYGITGNVDRRLNFGQPGDKPIVGDFNNDGITDIGVFRSGQWILDYGMDGTVNRQFNYGLPTDIPVVGNFNNDGITDIGVFRSGQWILDYGMDVIVDLRLNYGLPTDIPLAGKWV